MSIFSEVTVSLILSNKLYMYTCPIANGSPDTAISLYSILGLAPNIVRQCRCTAPLYEACESV